MKQQNYIKVDFGKENQVKFRLTKYSNQISIFINDFVHH